MNSSVECDCDYYCDLSIWLSMFAVCMNIHFELHLIRV